MALLTLFNILPNKIKKKSNDDDIKGKHLTIILMPIIGERSSLYFDHKCVFLIENERCDTIVTLTV